MNLHWPELRWLHVANALLLVAFWVYVIVMWSRLPEQVPQHMGVDGQPTRFGNRGIWLLIPIMASMHVVVMYGLGSATSTAQGFNVPHKKRLLRLPRAAQVHALEPARRLMFCMATWLLALSWVVQLMIHAGAVGAREWSGWLAGALGVLTVAPLVGVWWVWRAVGRRVSAAEGAVAQRSTGAP